MSDEQPVTDAPRSADAQDAPAAERPADDSDHRPSQAEGDRLDNDDNNA